MISNPKEQNYQIEDKPPTHQLNPNTSDKNPSTQFKKFKLVNHILLFSISMSSCISREAKLYIYSTCVDCIDEEIENRKR